MDTQSDDASSGPVAADAPVARYVGFSLDSGDVIIYDREGADAWIQSATAVDLAQMA